MKPYILLCSVALTGCASDKAYYEAIESRTRSEQTIAVAKAEADKARYAAIASMASTGGDAAKVAAMFSLMQMQPSAQPQVQSQQIAPAPSPVDRVLQVLQLTNNIITPWIAPVMAYKQGQTNANVSIAQANANKDIFLGSYSAIAQVAGKIQAPAANVTNNTTTTTNANQTTTNANQTSTTTNTSTTSTNTATTTIGRDGVIGDGVLTRTCAAGSGGPGAGGAAGGSAAANPSSAASGVPGSATATGGSGALGGSGGMGGALTC